MNIAATSNLNPQLALRLRRIKAFLLDVDGVLTDSAITLTPDGLESRVFHMMDTDSIQAAQSIGVHFGIITTHASDAVLERARELNIHDIYHGSYDKAEAYDEFKSLYELDDAEIAFMGDGMLDVSVLKQVGFAAAPSNAHPSARMAAHYVSRYRGGHGAVREVLTMLVQSQDEAGM
ncbi:HAD hydrolase family protein [bacterium]|nr:HAD hydrolase family protein [bacterium]